MKLCEEMINEDGYWYYSLLMMVLWTSSALRRCCCCCCLMGLCVLATFTDISGQVLNCYSVQRWRPFSASPSGDRSASTMTRFPTQSHYSMVVCEDLAVRQVA